MRLSIILLTLSVFAFVVFLNFDKFVYAEDTTHHKTQLCFDKFINYSNPLYKDLTQVVMAVDTKPNGVLPDDIQNALPDVVQKKNLEKMLLDLYTQKLGKPVACRTDSIYKIILFDTTKSDQRRTMTELTNKNDTLLILLYQHIQGINVVGQFVSKPMSAFHLMQHRANVNGYRENQWMPIFTAEHEIIEQDQEGVLEYSFKQWILY